MKKLMILGAGVYQYPLVKYACEHYDVVLVAPTVSEKFKAIVDNIYLLDLREKNKILEIAIMEKIDGIITDQTDIPVRTVAYVASKLNLPGNDYETACLFTDKNLMREKLVELDLPYIPFETVSSVEDGIESAKKIGFPVIIKPVDNQGSRGVAKINTVEEFSESFPDSIAVSTSKKVIVEKYIDGIEAVVEGICVDGKFQNLVCGDTYYFSDESVFSAKQRLFPSKLPKELTEKILNLNKKIIEGFGLTQGITHSEYIISENNDVYLIETAARGGGVFISSDLISLPTGICTEKILTDMALGNEVNINIEKKEIVCCYIAFFLPQGEVIANEGIKEVQRLEYVHNNILDNISIGLKTVEAKDKTSRFSIIVSAKDYDELDRNIGNIKSLLQVKVQTSEGIKLPIWE